MDIQRAMKVQDKFLNLPDEAKKYVNDLVNEAEQKRKSTVVMIVETELNPKCNWNKSPFYGPYLGDDIDVLII